MLDYYKTQISPLNDQLEKLIKMIQPMSEAGSILGDQW